MAGAPAVALRAGAGRQTARRAAAAGQRFARRARRRSGALIRKIALGVEPIAAVISADSRIAYVSILGGPKPKPGQRAATQCCDPRAEAVRVDERGIAEPGSVSARGSRDRRGHRHIPSGGIRRRSRGTSASARLYVAAGNTDSIAVIDTRRERVVDDIAIAPFRDRKIGLAPTALALSPDARTLYVALGGVNAVAVYDVRGAPTLARTDSDGVVSVELDVSADGATSPSASLFGVGRRHRDAAREDGALRVRGARRGERGSRCRPTPSSPRTRRRWPRTTGWRSRRRQRRRRASRRAAARAVPERPGDPSLVSHVVFIVRENRTYDQVLGDHEHGRARQLARDVRHAT